MMPGNTPSRKAAQSGGNANSAPASPWACARTWPSSAPGRRQRPRRRHARPGTHRAAAARADQVFHLDLYTAALTFIVAFGVAKAATNYFAGTLSDRYGRKPVLSPAGSSALPVPLLLIWAPTWGWIVAANVLLGINQGLTWSTTVIMKIDLVGPARRGLAMGLNEAAGYLAVAVTALATGYIAASYGLRPEPFFLGIAYAALGLGLSALSVRETRGHARLEAANHTCPAPRRHAHGRHSATGRSSP